MVKNPIKPPQIYRFGLRDPDLVYGDDIYKYLQNL
jgi:hypothetical protein